MMMSANLVGFAIGVDGMKYMIQELFKNVEGKHFMSNSLGSLIILRLSVLGLMFLFISCCCLFVGVQVMFEYR